jgi:adenylate kinase family enzyme
MNKSEIENFIASNQPKVIYLSGKTSTGKSTFARFLRDNLGYSIIELDEIVVSSVIRPLDLKDRGQVFIDVYKERGKIDLINRFVLSGRKLINSYIENNKPVIVEGALANSKTLKELFANYPDFTFINFHPLNLNIYKEYLLSRFMTTNLNDHAGLPNGFWKFVDDQDFKQFCNDRVITNKISKSIENFALYSIQESEKRLNQFKEHFNNISIVTI